MTIRVEARQQTDRHDAEAVAERFHLWLQRMVVTTIRQKEN